MGVTANRLESVQIMRGIAASAVMLGHLTGGNFQVAFPEFSLLFSYGYLGVTMFFVISGFVIPHAMDAMNYRVPDAGSFLLRRIVRLEPTFIISVLLAVIIAFLAARTPGYRGDPFTLSLKEFLLQFLYLAPWFNEPWINLVAWTLAIEFQYYLLILLAAPLLLSRSRLLNGIFFSAVIASSLITPDGRAVFRYLPSFAVGFSVFLFHSKRIGVQSFLALCVLFVGLTAINEDVVRAVTAAISAALILLPLNRPLPLLTSLGTISYSLYLMHQPIGGRVINLVMRVHSSWIQLGGLVAAVGASLLVATALWYFIERPSHARASAPLRNALGLLWLSSIGKHPKSPSAESGYFAKWCSELYLKGLTVLGTPGTRDRIRRGFLQSVLKQPRNKTGDASQFGRCQT
jgi:peptidoglycan/LPS O-acetylase OafA/YrhL